MSFKYFWGLLIYLLNQHLQYLFSWNGSFCRIAPLYSLLSMKDIWDAKHNTMVSIKYEQLHGSVLGYGIKQVLVHSARIKKFRIIESCYKSFIGSKSQLFLSLVQLISVEYTSKFKKNKLPQKKYIFSVLQYKLGNIYQQRGLA